MQGDASQHVQGDAQREAARRADSLAAGAALEDEDPEGTRPGHADQDVDVCRRRAARGGADGQGRQDKEGSPQGDPRRDIAAARSLGHITPPHTTPASLGLTHSPAG